MSRSTIATSLLTMVFTGLVRMLDGHQAVMGRRGRAHTGAWADILSPRSR